MSEFEDGDRVLHSEYGTGTFVQSNRSRHSILVEFDSGRGRFFVDERDCEPAEELLRNVNVDRAKEWADEAYDSTVLYGGEVGIDLDFADGVEYDVDVGPDGNIIVQYWKKHEVDQ